MNKSDLCVYAKDIYEWLQVEMKFEDWIVKRIKEYKFKENQDFIIVSEMHFLSVEMGKELGMIERTLIGEKTRAHFIACEKLAQEQIPRLEAENNRLRRKIHILENSN